MSNPSPSDNRLPLKKVLGYGCGGIPFGIGTDAVKQLASPIYNIVLGVNPAVLGTILMVARLYDACTDPLVGFISDNTRSRWGRRRPFILVGATLTGIAFPLIWWVPVGATPQFAAAYFAGAVLLFYTVFTVFCVPFVTLGMEISPDYAERARVVGIRTMFSMGAGLMVVWAFRIAQLDIFTSVAVGMRWVGVVIGVSIIASGWIVFSACKERSVAAIERQPRQPIVAWFKAAVKNGPYRILMGLTVTIIFGSSTFNALGIYVNTYYVCGGDTKRAATLVGLSGTAYTIMAWVVIPLVIAAVRRWGKHATLAGCLVAGVLCGASRWFIYNPRYPYLQLLESILLAPAASGFWVVVNSMKADICDHDELSSGVRREGVFAAVSSWLQKFTIALTFSAAGWVLLAIGFDRDLGADQAPHTITLLRAVFSLAPALAFGFGLVLLRRYPLTESSVRAIRVELNRRAEGALRHQVDH